MDMMVLGLIGLAMLVVMSRRFLGISGRAPSTNSYSASDYSTSSSSFTSSDSCDSGASSCGGDGGGGGGGD